jgi:hypothetical protein
VAAKADTPKDIVGELSAAFLKAAEAPSYKEYEHGKLLDLKADGKLGSEDFRAVIAQEYELKKAQAGQ